MSLFTKAFSARKISRAFTLMELMIVIVVIGILASVAVPRYSKVIKKARIAEADSALGALRGAEIRYEIEHPGKYASITKLDVTPPTSEYFVYSASATTGTVTAKGKEGTAMYGVTVNLKIDGTRELLGL